MRAALVVYIVHIIVRCSYINCSLLFVFIAVEVWFFYCSLGKNKVYFRFMEFFG